MSRSHNLRYEVSRFLEFALRLTPVFALMSIFAAVFMSAATLPVGIACLLTGVCAFGLLLLSWRHHSYWWSWTILVIPSVALLGSVVGGLVLPVVRAGHLNPLGALSAVLGLTGLGFLGPLLILRNRVRQWFGA